MANVFLAKLEKLLDAGRAPLCVGLDPQPALLPARYPDLLAWQSAIIEATCDQAVCYKPNIAFYEALGWNGYQLLQETLARIPAELPVILDAKRGDIGSTAQAYARSCFEIWDVDAVTVNPYLGEDGIRPFLAYEDRYTFLLCHTSNPSAHQIQAFSHRGLPLYQHVARLAAGWNAPNLGFVVGATYPQTLAEIRSIASQAWILAPGVGAQGGDAASTLALGAGSNGRGVLINASRSIALASDHRQALAAIVAEMQRQPMRASQVDDDRHRLALMLHDLGCIQFGEFRLASGLSSPIYIDLRLLVSDSSAMALSAMVYRELLEGLAADRIAGVPYGALPIATAISLETGMPMIYTRRQVKDHGRGRSIEGAWHAGERVIVVEDLITTGGSIIDSIDILRQHGLLVSDAAVLIDREQGGETSLQMQGVRLHTAFRLRQLLAILLQSERITALEYEQVLRYLNDSG